ncbi:MAG: hypothetical protein J4A00_06910 [Gammaproteobacteria bacterium]|nr:hypothetical protein [Gammaproteobacteria bacterium]
MSFSMIGFRVAGLVLALFLVGCGAEERARPMPTEPRIINFYDEEPRLPAAVADAVFLNHWNSDRMTVTMYKMAKGMGPQYPIKTDVNKGRDEIAVMLKGTCDFTAGESFKRRLVPGDIMIIPEGLTHGGVCGADGSEVLMLVFFTPVEDRFGEEGSAGSVKMQKLHEKVAQ